MSPRGVKATVVFVAASAVVLVSLWARFARRRTDGTGRTPGGMADSVALEEKVDAGGLRSRIGGVPQRVHGFINSLTDVEKHMGEAEQIVARFKLGRGGRHLPGVGHLAAPEAGD